jgi:hypothetical protein
MKLNLMFHDNCFDGTASAAVFLRYYLEKVNSHADITLIGMAHQAGPQFQDGLFSADENAIVDFKYASTDRLTWWFDHHRSAFLTPEDERHFLNDRTGKKFYDPSFKSCTKFIATVAAEQFSFETSSLDELIHWADIIDGALYPDAKTAVEMEEPAQKLATVIETTREPEFIHRLIRQLAFHPLNQVATQKTVMDRFEALREFHRENLRIIGENSHCSNGVMYFDLTGYQLEGYNKFIPYYLYPEINYSVSLLRSSKRVKVSVGWNPWSKAKREHNLAVLCERYGGGGHPVVAAISFEPYAEEKARAAANQIVAELRQSVSDFH